MANENDQCIVAIAPCCGRIVMATADTLMERTRGFRVVRACRRQGYQIEMRTTEQVLQGDWTCRCPDAARIAAGLPARKKKSPAA